LNGIPIEDEIESDVKFVIIKLDEGVVSMHEIFSLFFMFTYFNSKFCSIRLL